MVDSNLNTHTYGTYRLEFGNHHRGRSILTTERKDSDIIEGIPDTPENVMRAIVTNVVVETVDEDNGVDRTDAGKEHQS